MQPLAHLVAVFLAAAVAGCDESKTSTEQLVSESFASSYPGEQATFEKALAQAGVPYKIEMQDGQRYATWSAEHKKTVDQVKADFFGKPLPPGRHLHLTPPEYQKKFEAWLSENSVPYSVQQSHGREYIVWEEQFTAKVNSWKDLPSLPAAAAEAPNPSIERTSPRKPGAASHVKRWASR